MCADLAEIFLLKYEMISLNSANNVHSIFTLIYFIFFDFVSHQHLQTNIQQKILYAQP